VLTPLFCLLAWAREPITEGTMNFLLQTHHLAATSRWGELFRRAFEHGHLMLQQRPTPDGETGWTIYHDSFRQYLLESETVRDNREWAQERWLKVCEDWKGLASQEPSLHRYVLRYYAEHLREAKRWDELFALARDDEFRQAQAQAFPADPDLPLRTVQVALLGAAERDDAGAMAEFLITHAWRLLEIRQENPLEALRKGHLRRAWELADLYEIERCVLWYLLLAWELKDSGRPDDALQDMERLMQRDPPHLPPFFAGTFAIDILPHLFEVHPLAFARLCRRLLDDEARASLVGNLISMGRLEEAIIVAQAMEDVGWRGGLLRRIREVQAQAKPFEQLPVDYGEKRRTMFMRMLAPDIDVEIRERALALSDIAEVQAGLEQSQQAQDTFQQALSGGVVPYQYIAVTQAQLGYFPQAYETAQKIEEVGERAETLAAIATVLVKTGHQEQAGELIEEAQRVAGAQALGTTARALAEIGDFEQARALAGEIKQAEERARALASIAMMQVRADREEDGQRTFALAKETACKIEDAEEQAKTLTWIAVTQAHAGQEAESKETLTQAKEAARQIRYEGERRCALAHMREALVHMQLIAGRTAEAEATARGIEHEYGLIRARALTAIAEAKVRVGDGKAALLMTDAILRNRSEFLYHIATALAEAGDKVNFKQLLLPCAYYLDAAYRMCGLLARLYPEKAEKIAEVVQGSSESS
jgi:hypothetical protein